MYEVAIRNNDLLPAIVGKAIHRNDLFPVIYEPVILKTPWYLRKPKIETVMLETYFEYEENEMVVFKITPHANVAGNNKRLWVTIHKMYEMYDSMKSRASIKGKKLHYREKDYFWFDIIFRQEKGQRKIDFYVSTSAFQAKKLKRKIENTMHVTLSDATLADLQIPVEDTIVQDLRYMKHDIFSLNTNTNSNERQMPLASILNTVDEMHYDGDMARLSICNEVENRKKWMKNASWAKEKLNEGRVPQRTNMMANSAIPYVKTGIAGLVNEINHLVRDTMEAISNVFFSADSKYKHENVIEKGYSLEDEINSSTLTTASISKVNQPVFRTHIRVASHSSDKLTRDTMGETLAMSVNDMAENNEIRGVKLRKADVVISELNELKLTKKTRHRVDVNLMSSDEMSKLALQMPMKELQMKYVDALNTRKTVETVIPNALQSPGNLLIGHAQVKDEEIPVGLDTTDKELFYRGYVAIGGQGVGKDTAIQNIVREGAMKHGISYIIPDWICEPGNKGMADGIRDLLPPDKIIDLDLSNEEWIIPMDLTEVIQKLGRKGGSRFALEMVDFLDMGDLPRSQKYLMEASKASNGSLRNIKKIIEDEDFRIQTIKRLISEGNERAATDLVNWGTNDDLSNKCDAIMSRLNMFFGDDTLSDIFSQPPKQEVDFDKWMREGKTIIIRMPKRVLGDASNVLAHWVTLKVLMTRLLMSAEDKEKHGCFMVFNEPEQVESKGLSELMGRIATEGRKERLGSIFAFHHWDKLPIHLQKNLDGGGVNQLLFASSHKKTYEMVKERLLQTFTLEEALHTPRHHAIALLNGAEPIPPFLVHMLPPVPNEERYDNSALTQEHAKMYGRSWEELQQMY